MIGRIGVTLGLLVLAMIAPWWVTLIVGVISTALFPWFIEIIFIGILYDALFGGVVGTAWYSHGIHTLIFSSVLFIAEFIKNNIIS